MIKSFDQYQKNHFQKADKKQFFWLTRNPFIARKEKEILQEIIIEKPREVLEVGCGEGANLVNLRALGLKAKINGVDYSPAKIAFARKRIYDAKLLVADAYQLPFNDGQFDFVFAKSLLHHLHDKKRAIGEMVRVCRPGGKIMIFEGNGENPVNIIFGRLFQHERGMSESTVKKLLELINEEKFLKSPKILMSEPLNLFRALFHYRYGLPILGELVSFWFRLEHWLIPIIPKNYYGFIVIKTVRLTTARKIKNPLSIIEENHFSNLFNRKKLYWWDSPAGRLRIKRRVKLVKKMIKPGDQILELGCGIGEFTQQFKNIKNQITAIEIAPEVLKQAAAEIKSTNIKFLVGDCYHLSFKDNSFDIIIGNSILHHLDLSVVLPEIHRVLKDNAKIIFFEPNLVNPHVFLQKKIGIFKKISRDSPGETAFTRWYLQAELEQSGFNQVRIKPFDFLYPFLPKFFIPTLIKLESYLERLPGVREFSGSLMIYACVNKPDKNKIKNYWNSKPLFSQQIYS